ncbi:MAG: L,D-transpeptidase [Tatlockia sp.]|jgi:hypothetical protein
MKKSTQFIFISAALQKMLCFEQDNFWKSYCISTAKKGLGEQEGSECTPRGWHRIHSRIGLECPIHSVFVGRQWTGEIYSDALAKKFPERDWILTRILQLDGLEAGRNKGNSMDSLQRCIYIHGTPDEQQLGEPASHGCIRVANPDLIELANWVKIDTMVCIE